MIPLVKISRGYSGRAGAPLPKILSQMAMTKNECNVELLRRFISSDPKNVNSSISYEETIRALNGLQSSISSRGRSNEQNKNIEDSLKYLERCGVNLEEFEKKVSVIHVSGTKGKGSTCALCESILRAHGYRTGLYTSPHLISVRERIRLNGVPLSPDAFSKYFWEVYQLLDNNKEHDNDMPTYFKCLTVVAFYVFLVEKVDVAIIEVGIGGEHDCTNVLRRTPVVGITSLGLDHTTILGETVEEIAWEKAGIIKPGSIALTTPNVPSGALEVLRSRAREKQVELKLVPELDAYNLDVSRLNLTLQLNLPLALQLAYAWLKWKKNVPSNGVFNTLIDDKTLKGIYDCSWPGRFQTVVRGKHMFYLDGAHTQESTQLCAEWFNSIAPSEGKRLLVFNSTKGRDPFTLLRPFMNCNINTALFCSNILTIDPSRVPPDLVSKAATISAGAESAQAHSSAWQTLCGFNVSSREFSTVEDVISFVDRDEEQCHILVTGSLHLVGAILTLISNDDR